MKITISACDAVVERGNFLKFSQNQEMKDVLLSTGEKELIEASPNDKICIWLLRACKQQELDSRRRLIACQSEMAGFKTFNTSGWWFPVPRWLECGRGWVDAPRDGVNTVERSCEDQVVVGVQLLETWGECPVVD